MTQDEINRTQGENPDGSAGVDWIALYFSKKDSRTWLKRRGLALIVRHDPLAPSGIDVL